jgi:cytochrome oxidase Cu insertion factor (SCO1/SenC/PrrC family)
MNTSGNQPRAAAPPDAAADETALAAASLGEAQRRKRLSRRLMWSGTALVLFAVALSLLLDQHSTAHAPAGNGKSMAAGAIPVGSHEGQRAPNFTLRDLEGKSVSLYAFAGKPVLIHFWAVDCPTCRAEQADYLKAMRDLGKKAPEILAVDAWGETAGYIRSYVRKHGIPGIVLVDLSHDVFSNVYQSIGTPTAVYIDSRGVIRRLVTGQESYAQIVANAKLIGA